MVRAATKGGCFAAVVQARAFSFHSVTTSAADITGKTRIAKVANHLIGQAPLMESLPLRACLEFLDTSLGWIATGSPAGKLLFSLRIPEDSYRDFNLHLRFRPFPPGHGWTVAVSRWRAHSGYPKSGRGPHCFGREPRETSKPGRVASRGVGRYRCGRR